jgi:hypothetical protein
VAVKKGKEQEYRTVKEEYVANLSKKKALQSTFLHMISAYESSLHQMGSM